MATITVFPDPSGSQVTSFDATTGRTGVDEAMATIRGGAGNETLNFSPTNMLYLVGAATLNQFSILRRPIFLFDTSSLGSGATISAATFSIKTPVLNNGMVGDGSANSAMVLVASSPASINAVVNADYGTFGTTDFGRSGNQSTLSTTAYNDITINASGLATISKAGTTKFALKQGWDFDNTITGLTILNGQDQGPNGKFSEEAGTGSDPQLVVTYTAGSTTVSPNSNLLSLGVG